MIVDHDNHRVLDVLENREKATISRYLQQCRQGGLLAHVEEVTIDMWSPYEGAVREAFGNGVTITIDRFHVMKNFQECLTKARRELQRQMAPEERSRLKGSRWLWVTNPENLTLEERQQLQALKQEFPRLGQIADQREALRAIFEDRTIRSPAEGRKRLQAWLAQRGAIGHHRLDHLLHDFAQLVQRNRQLFPESGEQWPRRRIESRSSRHPLAGLWHGEL